MMTAMALAMTVPGATLAQAQQAQPPAPAAKAATRAETVAAIRKAIARDYVVKDKKAALDAALAKGLASGRYAVEDPQEAARRMTEDMAAIANDKHLSVSYQPEIAAQLPSEGQSDEIDDSPFFKAFARSQNHGVLQMRVLPGNIRLVDYQGFVWTGAESASALDAAMAFLRGGDAAIIDMRRNGGGSPEAVRHLASYFVPAGAKLVTFHLRSDPPSVSTAADQVPGGRLAAMPVYVLTSGHTASAAEEFASHVAGFGFGTLVGETTAGAAYRNEQYGMPGGFALSVSIGYPELPKGGNWEAKGVAPAIAVPEALALERALQAAELKLAEKAEGARRTELEWAAAMHGARVAPVKPRLPLDHYAGRYGVRGVTVENGHLFYQRDGGPRSELIPVGPDLFALELDPRARIRFTGGDSVTGLEIERADGSKTPSPRS